MRYVRKVQTGKRKIEVRTRSTKQVRKKCSRPRGGNKTEAPNNVFSGPRPPEKLLPTARPPLATHQSLAHGEGKLPRDRGKQDVRPFLEDPSPPTKLPTMAAGNKYCAVLRRRPRSPRRQPTHPRPSCGPIDHSAAQNEAATKRGATGGALQDNRFHCQHTGAGLPGDRPETCPDCRRGRSFLSRPP